MREPPPRSQCSHVIRRGRLNLISKVAEMAPPIADLHLRVPLLGVPIPVDPLEGGCAATRTRVSLVLAVRSVAQVTTTVIKPVPVLVIDTEYARDEMVHVDEVPVNSRYGVEVAPPVSGTPLMICYQVKVSVIYQRHTSGVLSAVQGYYSRQGQLLSSWLDRHRLHTVPGTNLPFAPRTTGRRRRITWVTRDRRLNLTASILQRPSLAKLVNCTASHRLDSGAHL